MRSTGSRPPLESLRTIDEDDSSVFGEDHEHAGVRCDAQHPCITESSDDMCQESTPLLSRELSHVPSILHTGSHSGMHPHFADVAEVVEVAEVAKPDPDPESDVVRDAAVLWGSHSTQATLVDSDEEAERTQSSHRREVTVLLDIPFCLTAGQGGPHLWRQMSRRSSVVRQRDSDHSVATLDRRSTHHAINNVVSVVKVRCLLRGCVCHSRTMQLARRLSVSSRRPSGMFDIHVSDTAPISRAPSHDRSSVFRALGRSVSTAEPHNDSTLSRKGSQHELKSTAASVNFDPIDVKVQESAPRLVPYLKFWKPLAVLSFLILYVCLGAWYLSSVEHWPYLHAVQFCMWR